MRVSVRLSVILAVALFVMALAPASSMALTVTKTTAPACDTHTGYTDWSRSLQLPQFNVAGGTLTHVAVTRDVSITSRYEFESFGDGRTTTLDLLNADVQLDLPGVGLLSASLPASTRNYTGNGPFTGTFGTGTQSRVDAPALAGWIGSGTVALAASADAATEHDLTGNFDLSWRTPATVTACVTYTYTEEILVCIGDYVWYDTNKDGIQDPTETGVADRSVTVVDAAGNPLGSTRTDANGRWKVCQLEPSTACVVDVDLPDGWNLTSYKTGARDVDSDGIASGADARIPDCMTPPAGEDLTFDIGIHQAPTPVDAPAPAPGKLRLTKAANMKTTRSGGVVRFTVRVTNRGVGALRNVRVCDLPPTQFAFTKRPRGTVLRNGQLCWTVKTIRAKKSVTLRYTMRAAKVPTRTCATNRVTGLVAGASASAKRTVCIRPTQLGLLKLAG